MPGAAHALPLVAELKGVVQVVPVVPEVAGGAPEVGVAAQVVGLADAYETLTTGSGSQPPVPCATAVQMLCTGEAGAFNPVLLDCLREIENEIDDAMRRRPETL